MRNYTGCPCGCMTKLPWLDDPDCIRHQPIELMSADGMTTLAETMRDAADEIARTARVTRQQEKLAAFFKTQRR